jgi:hypothetical protein
MTILYTAELLPTCLPALWALAQGAFLCARFSLSRSCARAYRLTDRHNIPLPRRPPDLAGAAGEGDLPGYPIGHTLYHDSGYSA